MPGYTGYHTTKSGWSPTTIMVVVAAHLIAGYGLYQLVQTDFVRDLIKVTKLVTVPEPPRPSDQPQPEEELKTEPLPEITQERTPPVLEPPPEPIESAPAEEQPVSTAQEGASPDSGPPADTPFAIGKPGSRFSGYEGLLTAAIQAVYQQPPDLPDGLDYAVMCQLILDDDGYVLGYKLVNSSGNEAFDRSTLRALSRLRQVRPPPQGLSRTIIVKFFPP